MWSCWWGRGRCVLRGCGRGGVRLLCAWVVVSGVFCYEVFLFGCGVKGGVILRGRIGARLAASPPKIFPPAYRHDTCLTAAIVKKQNPSQP